jgi:DNA-binding transcriptional ArsR family regulator
MDDERADLLFHALSDRTRRDIVSAVMGRSSRPATSFGPSVMPWMRSSSSSISVSVFWFFVFINFLAVGSGVSALAVATGFF